MSQSIFTYLIATTLILSVASLMLGSWSQSSETSLNSEINQKLIEFALQTLSAQDSGFEAQGWKVNQILSLQTQSVSGTNYRMTVELLSTDGSTMTMTWTIWYQPWTGTIKLTQSVVDSAPTKTTNDATSVVGGYTPESVNMNDPTLQEVVAAGIAAYNTQNSANGPWKVDQVVSLAEEVVAGMNYMLDVILINSQNQTQEVEWIVYSQPWMNSYTLISSTPVPGARLRNLQYGGWTPQSVDMNSPALQTAIETAMTNLTSGNGLLSSGNWTVTQVLSVATQLVAGTNYQILAEITNEENNESMFILWVVNEQPWNNKSTLVSYEIEQENLNMNIIPGGIDNESPNSNSPGVQTAINTFLANATQENGLLGEGDWISTQILSVQTQVVSGENYIIEAEFTNQDNNATMTVKFTVWEQSWTNTNTLTSAEVISSDA